MFYERIRDAYSLYKRDVCSSFEHFHKAIELIYNLGPDREVVLGRQHGAVSVVVFVVRKIMYLVRHESQHAVVF